MLENSWYSVISPENCSSILWRSWDQKERAAEVLKLTADDGIKLNIVDGIIKEPSGGAHSNREETFEAVRNQIMTAYKELNTQEISTIVNDRMNKYINMGVYKE